MDESVQKELEKALHPLKEPEKWVWKWAPHWGNETYCMICRMKPHPSKESCAAMHVPFSGEPVLLEQHGPDHS